MDSQSKNKLPDFLEEYFVNNNVSRDLLLSQELFKADENLDLKTDVTPQELVLANKILFFDNFLTSRGIDSSFLSFIRNFLRLKISQDRKSRSEFVNLNNPTNLQLDNSLQRISNFKNIMDSKS